MRDRTGTAPRFHLTRPPGPRLATPGQQGRACDSQAAFGPPFFLAALTLAALGGCGTLQAYDGPRLPPGARATVQADLLLAAARPVQVILRQVDGHAVPAGRARVELAPGRHRLLADCRVTATGATARFAVDVELEAGRAYRLGADASALRCEALRLDPR